MPLKKRVNPSVSPREDMLIIDTNNGSFNRKSHENYFHDFFGFKDKGKKQMNENFPLKDKLYREFNIVSNTRFQESHMAQTLQESPNSSF
jgi:hypothetical protein